MVAIPRSSTLTCSSSHLPRLFVPRSTFERSPPLLRPCRFCWSYIWYLEVGYDHIKNMSTGVPVSGIDGNIPAANGHGQSRSRGHSRSTRSAQAPSPIPVPPNPFATETPYLEPVTGIAYTNGHVSHPSCHGHQHSHSQGSVHYAPGTPSPVKSAFHDHAMIYDGESRTPELLVEPNTSNR